MKSVWIYMIALCVVAVWAVFSYGYLGVEDGSSGLSPLGWVHAVFFIPGGFLLHAMKGTHSNTDLPMMAVFGLCVYAVVVVLVIEGIRLVRRALYGGKSNYTVNTDA